MSEKTAVTIYSPVFANRKGIRTSPSSDYSYCLKYAMFDSVFRFIDRTNVQDFMDRIARVYILYATNILPEELRFIGLESDTIYMSDDDISLLPRVGCLINREGEDKPDYCDMRIDGVTIFHDGKSINLSVSFWGIDGWESASIEYPFWSMIPLGEAGVLVKDNDLAIEFFEVVFMGRALDIDIKDYIIKKNSDGHCVYTLSYPGEDVFYVGYTSCPSKRILSHFCKPHNEHLKENMDGRKRAPDMNILKTFDSRYMALKYEKSAIKEYSEKYVLANIADNPNR